MKTRNAIIPVLALIVGWTGGILTRSSHSRLPFTPESRPGVRALAIESEKLIPVQAELNANSILASLIQERGMRRLAQLGELFEKWTREDIRTLADRMDEAPGAVRERVLAEFFGAWCQHHPSDASAWMRFRLESACEPGLDLALAETDALRVWAKNAPTDAVAFALENPDTEAAQYILEAWWPELHEAVSTLNRYPHAEVADPRPIESYFAAQAERDLTAALTEASAILAPKLREIALGGVLSVAAEKAPVSALEQASALGITDPEILAKIVDRASSGSKAIADWLASRGEARPDNVLARLLATSWAASDPVEALTWARTSGIAVADPIGTRGRDSAIAEFYTPLHSAMKSTELAAKTMEWALSLPPGQERDRYVEILARRVEAGDLPNLIPSLPSDAAAGVAARYAWEIGFRDPQKAAAWSDTLEGEVRKAAWIALGSRMDPGGGIPFPTLTTVDRDAILLGMTFQFSDDEFTDQLARAYEISDPTLRELAADQLKRRGKPSDYKKMPRYELD